MAHHRPEIDPGALIYDLSGCLICGSDSASPLYLHGFMFSWVARAACAVPPNCHFAEGSVHRVRPPVLASVFTSYCEREEDLLVLCVTRSLLPKRRHGIGYGRANKVYEQFNEQKRNISN